MSLSDSKKVLLALSSVNVAISIVLNGDPGGYALDETVGLVEACMLRVGNHAERQDSESVQKSLAYAAALCILAMALESE